MHAHMTLGKEGGTEGGDQGGSRGHQAGTDWLTPLVSGEVGYYGMVTGWGFTCTCSVGAQDHMLCGRNGGSIRY